MGPFWKTPLLDMSPGLPGRPGAGHPSPMNMSEHLACYDESLIGMCDVWLIMFVCIAAVLAVIPQPGEASSGTKARNQVCAVTVRTAEGPGAGTSSGGTETKSLLTP